MALNAQDDESLDRLEQALNRIEAGVDRPDPVAGEVAARLDAIILRLQKHLQAPLEG